MMERQLLPWEAAPDMDAERLSVYLRSLEPDGPPLLQEMEQRARKEYIPVIRPETAAFLRTILTVRKPRRVLEIGTAIGYSALVMLSVLPPEGHITTMELSEERLADAREYIRRAGVSDRITLLQGDAGEILQDLAPAFDFIFLDGPKGQYPLLLPDLLRLLAPEGILVSDNVLQEGTLLESRYAIPRRERTIHARMREFLYDIKHRNELETAILPVGDGVAVSVRKP